MHLVPALTVFPEDSVPHSLFPQWNPFRGCWRSAVAAAHDLIFVDVDGKCHFVGDTVYGSMLKSVGTDPFYRFVFSEEWNYLYIESESESHWIMFDSLQPFGLYSPWNYPGQNTGVGSLSLLQGIFPTQGLNPRLPYCRLFTSWATREAQEYQSR